MSDGNSSSAGSTALRVLGILAAGAIAFGLVLIAVAIFFVAGAIRGSDSDNESTVSSTGSGKVAYVEVDGIILNAENTVRQILKYRADSSIRAIVVRIESPGGSPSASEEIFQELKRTQKVKPVVASMGNIAASGGYYVALGAQKIVASPSTITGSIGVIAQMWNVTELMKKVGVTSPTYKTGDLKDMGSPLREPNEKDKAALHDLIFDTYDQFVNHVATERCLSVDTVHALADGRVYTGAQAYANHLVDTLGTRDDAIHLAARLAGISGDPKLVREHKKRSIIDQIVSPDESSSSIKELLDQPFLQYRMSVMGR
jgi:protease-4